MNHDICTHRKTDLWSPKMCEETTQVVFI